ncbi:hypothetical protein F4823DRAFT_616440 [Ustulina deusta]|nr:hypothetical protein F4823DRAFT_616440 [Ustulina deusta]
MSTVYEIPAAVFQDIIRTSSRAAVAIESYFFVQTRSIYYYFLPWLDVPGYANLTFTTKTQVPTRRNGLVSVIVLE